jgi:hypothetical protein
MPRFSVVFERIGRSTRMGQPRIEVSQSARERLAAYVVDHPEATAIRVFLEQGG